MLYRYPYEDGHVYVCSKVVLLAHPMPGHGKKSGYATVNEMGDTIMLFKHYDGALRLAVERTGAITVKQAILA